MKRLNVELIIKLHELQIEEFGGLNGVRDRNMLESSVHMPHLTFDGLVGLVLGIEKEIGFATSVAKMKR